MIHQPNWLEVICRLERGLTASGVDLEAAIADQPLRFHLECSQDICREWLTFHNSGLSQEDFAQILESVSGFKYFGDLPDDDDTDQVAGFGLILCDRLANAALAGESGWKWVNELLALDECALAVMQVVGGHRTKVEAEVAIRLRSNARQAAIAMHERSPAGKAKAIVKDCWRAWRKQPQQYEGAADFARAMIDKFPDELTSQPVIERWVRNWNRTED